MKTAGILILTTLIFIHCNAQNAVFLTSGKIEYERKVNQYEMLKENSEGAQELFQQTASKFYSSYFNLTFSGNKVLYQPGRENTTDKKLNWFSEVAQDNVIYSDYDQSQCTSQKKVFEQVFLVKDSTRKIKWKITDENRVIAGFQCRRANAIIMDSFYVVAFYTDEIIAPGGPESFCGLPGMILGVALPHQHVTWFATKVDASPVRESDMVMPVKGKKVTNAVLKETLKTATKDWGKWAQRYLEAAEL